MSLLRDKIAALRHARRRSVWQCTLVLGGAACAVFVLTLAIVDVHWSLPPLRLRCAGGLGLLVIAALVGWRSKWGRCAESDVRLALLLERRYGLNNELVGALQLAEPVAAVGESLALRQAVVAEGERLIQELEIPAPLRGPGRRRQAWIAAALSLTSWMAWGIAEPDTLSVFWARLGGRDVGYVTLTQVTGIDCNGCLLLDDRSAEQSSALPVRLAAGTSCRWTVRAAGARPSGGKLRLVGPGGALRWLDLSPIPQERLQQRRDLLRQSLRLFRVRAEEELRERLGMVAQQVSEELPATSAALRWARDDPQERQRAAQAIQKRLNWLTDHPDDSFYEAAWDLPAETLVVHTSLGDARVAPLPIEGRSPPRLQLAWSGQPPASLSSAAATEFADDAWPSGSNMTLSASCFDGRALQRVRAELRWGDQSAWLELAPDGVETTWILRDVAPLSDLRQRVRVRAAACDLAGLWSDAAAEIAIDVRPDGPPTASLAIAHQIVLPSARPIVDYRAADDRGLVSASLVVTAERAARSDLVAEEPGQGQPNHHSEMLQPRSFNDASGSVAQGSPQATDQQTMTTALLLEPGADPPRSLLGQQTLDLAPLQLAAGDWVLIELLVQDYPQSLGNEWTRSDPLTLRIGELQDVIQAITAADEQTEQRLDELIRRHLGADAR